MIKRVPASPVRLKIRYTDLRKSIHREFEIGDFSLFTKKVSGRFFRQFTDDDAVLPFFSEYSFVISPKLELVIENQVSLCFTFNLRVKKQIFIKILPFGGKNNQKESNVQMFLKNIYNI